MNVLRVVEQNLGARRELAATWADDLGDHVGRFVTLRRYDAVEHRCAAVANPDRAPLTALHDVDEFDAPILTEATA